MASNTTPFKLDDGLATPSAEWAEATRAALDDKTAPAVGTGTSHAAAVPGGTAHVPTNSSTLPTGFSLANAPGNVSAKPAQISSTGVPAQIAPTGALAAVEPVSPGQHVPGAYPAPHEAVPSAPVDAGALAQDVGTMLQEARERLPAQEDLQQAAQDIAKTAQSYAQLATGYLPKSVADKLSDYLPTAQASENDVVHDKSLPTQETHGAQPGEKVAGVGALPGSVHEAAVAKLPGDDAATGLPEGMLPTLGAAATAGVVGYQASSNDISHDKSLPTQETHGALAGEKVEGAGALPGSVHESAVTTLPGDNATTPNKSLPTQEIHGAQPGETAGGVGALPGGVNESGVAKLPGDDAATGLPKGSAGAAIGAVAVVPTTSAVAKSPAPTSHTSTPTYTASARPEDMVPKSDAFPDARTHDSASKRSAGVPSTGADDKHVGSTKELPIPVAKGAGGQIPTSTLSPAKPEGTGKDTATDDKVRTATFPPAQLEPRKWTAWKGASAPGETPEEDLDLADNDVGGPPIDEEAYAKNLETQGASLDAAHGKSKPSDAHSQSGASAHTQGSKDESKHKASFMEKVKGEIKVISGKIGGDKHKVEEGKKLKTGEV